MDRELEQREISVCSSVASVSFIVEVAASGSNGSCNGESINVPFLSKIIGLLEILCLGLK